MERCQKDYKNTRGTPEPTSILSPEERKRICDEVARLYHLVADTSGKDLPAIRFDLKGRAAGQWRLRKNSETLRFNPEAFTREWDQHFPETVAHEVAHSLVYRTHGMRKVRPHGPEWKGLMGTMGFPNPRITHATALTTRKMRQYDYACGCGSQPLSARRHFLINKRGYRYQCRQCGQWLRRSDGGSWG
ncbi:SprT-like domain-containing protein [Thioalkalivibrio sp. AKL19]|uniref:SprT family zinc-dependent metalloprotease n=1 Tax=unclassified Thioalkalivibrio TaxID=2621013 RepID=UPI001E52BD5E|nr:SprT-like domain-containing protein [Thioalkalivibrio sp. AKL19]